MAETAKPITRPVYLVRVEGGYVARDREGKALLAIEPSQKKAGRYTRKGARKIVGVIGGGKIVRLVRKARVYRIEPPVGGFARKWLQCRECKKVYAYDYTPFGIGNPITWTPCGHSLGHRYNLNCDEVTPREAVEYFRTIYDKVIIGKAKS